MANESAFLESSQRVPAESKNYYRVIQQLGAGGNSQVYLVQAFTGPYQGLLFALKLFLRVSDKTRLGRFKKEVDFLKKCNHPSIMRVYDVGELAEVRGGATTVYPFVIAEYLPQTLYDAMRTGLSMAEKLSFSLQLLSGLAHLSAMEPQIVHRDIKPHNIFVRGKSCIIGDFGLMKLLGEEEEHDKDFIIESVGPRLPRFYRTPDLIAYCKGKGVLTVKSDVYQMGLVLAELFTGENPQKPGEKIYDDIELNPLLPIGGTQAASIASLIEKMLDSSPERRLPATDLLDPWDGVFRSVVQICHQLEGKVF